MTTQLAQIIDAAWDARSEISLDTKGEIRDAVNEAMAMLDSGTARVAEKKRQRMAGQSMAQKSRFAILRLE